MSATLVILAAGAGSRYGGLKQLAPIGPGGETLLEYSAFDALRAGFERAVLVVRPETEAEFRARLDEGMGRRMPIRYVHQTLDDLPGDATPPPGRVKPWGTGQAMLVADAAVDGPLAVLNADDFYGRRSLEILASALRADGTAAPSEVVLVGFEVARTLTDAGPVSRALCKLDPRGRLRSINELEKVRRSAGRIVYRDSAGVEQPLADDELVSMNLWGFSVDALEAVRRQFEDFLKRADAVAAGEFRIPDAVQALIADGYVVDVVLGGGDWCGITFREDHERAVAAIADLIDEGSYPRELWA